MKDFLWSISKNPESPIYKLLRTWNALHGTYVTVPPSEESVLNIDSNDMNMRGCSNISKCDNYCILQKLGAFFTNPSLTFRTTVKPKPLLMTMGRRKFKGLRKFQTLSGFGFVSSTLQLLKLHETMKPSGLSLVFQKVDKHCYLNDPGTLFIGNTPVVNVVNCTTSQTDRSARDVVDEAPTRSSLSFSSSKTNGVSNKGKKSSTSDINQFNNKGLCDLMSVLWSDECVISTLNPGKQDNSVHLSLICPACHKCVACVEENQLPTRLSDPIELAESCSSMLLSSDGRLVLSCGGSPDPSSSYGSSSTVRHVKKLVQRRHQLELTREVLNSLNNNSQNGVLEESNNYSSNCYKYHPRLSIDERIETARSE